MGARRKANPRASTAGAQTAQGRLLPPKAPNAGATREGAGADQADESAEGRRLGEAASG